MKLLWPTHLQHYTELQTSNPPHPESCYLDSFVPARNRKGERREGFLQGSFSISVSELGFLAPNEMYSGAKWGLLEIATPVPMTDNLLSEHRASTNFFMSNDGCKSSVMRSLGNLRQVLSPTVITVILQQLKSSAWRRQTETWTGPAAFLIKVFLLLCVKPLMQLAVMRTEGLSADEPKAAATASIPHTSSLLRMMEESVRGQVPITDIHSRVHSSKTSWMITLTLKARCNSLLPSFQTNQTSLLNIMGGNISTPRSRLHNPSQAYSLCRRNSMCKNCWKRKGKW